MLEALFTKLRYIILGNSGSWGSTGIFIMEKVHLNGQL